MRMSLARLLIDRVHNYSFRHLWGEPLLRFFRAINDLGVQQLQEDRDALASVASTDLTESVQASASGQTEPVGDPE